MWRFAGSRGGVMQRQGSLSQEYAEEKKQTRHGKFLAEMD